MGFPFFNIGFGRKFVQIPDIPAAQAQCSTEKDGSWRSTSGCFHSRCFGVLCIEVGHFFQKSSPLLPSSVQRMSLIVVSLILLEVQLVDPHEKCAVLCRPAICCCQFSSTQRHWCHGRWSARRPAGSCGGKGTSQW